MTGKQNSVTEKRTKTLSKKLRKGQTEFSIPEPFFFKLDFFFEIQAWKKMNKIFRSTVIIGTKIPKTKELFMITELNIYAALVLAGLLLALSYFD
jgi:hypothetical protein